QNPIRIATWDTCRRSTRKPGTRGRPRAATIVECDVIKGPPNRDDIPGAPGGNASRLMVVGGDGLDQIVLKQNMPGSLDYRLVFGGPSNDILVGTRFDDELAGDDGNDTIFGRGGNDFIMGYHGQSDIVPALDYDVDQRGEPDMFKDNDRLFGNGG